jgi:hypothetical protein
MPTVTLIEAVSGGDDTIKVSKDGTDTIFESIEDAARFLGEDEDWLESLLDDADYNREIDIDSAHDLDDAEESEEEEEEE